MFSKAPFGLMKDLLIGPSIQRSKEMVVEREGYRFFRLRTGCAWEGACGNFMVQR